MKKNSTSTIVRRSLLVIAFIALTHVFARAAWHFQLFGLNTPDGWDQVCTTSETDGLTFETICRMAERTSFWQYTSDTFPIIGTHFAGALLTAALFGLIYWIAFYSNPYDQQLDDISETPLCQDLNCPCDWHKADTFSNGQWSDARCKRQDCPCKDNHHGEKFDTDKQKWVFA